MGQPKAAFEGDRQGLAAMAFAVTRILRSDRWIHVLKRPLSRSVLAMSLACGLGSLGTRIVLAAGKNTSTTPIGSGPSAPALAPLNGASGFALDISNLFWIVLAEAGVVFALVMIALFINIFRFSHRPGHDEEPKQIYGNRRIEIAWTAIPAVILLVAFVTTVVVMNEVNSPADAASALKLEAVGHQWWWEFRLPKYHVVTANEIHIPVHTLVEVETTSVDVIHSFWVPQLDRQIDATPNNHTIVYINANRTGVFPGACYQYCGVGHAWMQFRMVVDTPAKFAAWARRQASPGASPTTNPQAQGQGVFFSQSCSSCHTIGGTPANGTAAPNLSHVGSRWGIAGGVLPMSEINLERWISDPNAWKPGALMPAFSLSKSDLHALAAYLISLK